MSLRYEGKAKRVFSTETVHQLRVEYKDEVTEVTALKRIRCKGRTFK